MPIIAIEGPDKCGKSTLYKKLQGSLDAKFISCPSFGKDRMHIASDLALRELEMWETFYEPERLYICDRHILTTDAVYAQLYKRPMLRESFLQSQIAVLYLDVALEELKYRHQACKEDIQDIHQYGLVRVLYDRVLRNYRCRILNYDTIDVVGIIKELASEIS